jgi:alpha-L-fucosidase
MKTSFKIKLLSILLLLNLASVFSQNGDEDVNMTNSVRSRDQMAIDDAVNGWWKEAAKTRDQRIEWWKDAKFGMFIHWGISSLPGGEWKGKRVPGYSEHLMRKEKITRAEYLELARQFNPTEFDADEWVSIAKQTGMRYLIVTAKHHDGFAMNATKFSDFNIIDQTNFKRDPMAELAEACRKYGIKFGFYYSHAFDWEHPFAPGNDWEYNNPGGDLLLHGRNWFDNRPDLLPNAVKYVDEKAIPQIRELLINYKPDIIWFDTPHKLPLSENLRILRAIRETDPNVVVNGRLARTGSTNFGDYINTGDRPAEFAPVKGDWEGIPTTNESYGYSKFDDSHKSVTFFIQLLAKATAKGGNTLMNIGPMGNGKFDPKDIEILHGIGKWMAVNGESIYGAERSPLAIQSWGVCTQKGNKLYLHVFDLPKDGKLIVGGLQSKVRNAYLLADTNKKSLKIKKLNAIDMFIQVPATAPDILNTVIVLEIDLPLKADNIRLLSPTIPNRLLAFDAQLIGKGFSFGDGKTNNYVVQNWKDKTQKLGWDLRLTSATKYRAKLHYATDTNSAGSFSMLVNNTDVGTYEIPHASRNRQVMIIDLGIVQLKKGVNTILIQPLSITQNELMKLLEIELIPMP